MYQHAKKSVHQFALKIQQISEFHGRKGHPHFRPQPPKNNEHDWNPVKYLNLLHHKRTQNQLRWFFLKYYKKILKFLFGVL